VLDIKLSKKLGSICQESCQHHRLLYLGYVQKIKPQHMLAAKVILFLCFMQRLSQSQMLAAIFGDLNKINPNLK
jgi:hypothetical protein